nr:cellulase family glycosylhydrolase [Mycolicibacterium sp. CBMA 360]
MFRALMLRVVVVLMPLAVICTYSHMGPTQPRMVVADVTPTAAIDDSNSTLGIADSSLWALSPADIATTLDHLQSIGVTNIRVNIPWAGVEPLKGVYNWSQMDAVMAAAKARNMGVLAMVNQTPAWGGVPLVGAPNPTDYANFMGVVANRYKGTISAYEVWNEQNCVCFYAPVDPVSYTNLLKAVYPVLKQIDPSVTVVAGGLGAIISAGGLAMDPTAYLTAMYAAGAKGFFDAIAFHPYQDTTPFSQGGMWPFPKGMLSQLHQVMVTNGDGTKLIWATEYGEASNVHGEQQQADYIKDMVNAWRMLTYTGPVFIYTTRDGVIGSDNMGIYQVDWTPKLAVAVIKQLIIDTVTNPVTSPIAALVEMIQKTIAQVQQAFASFTASLQTAFANAIKAVTDALSKIFKPAAAQPTTAGATVALAATSGDTLAAAKTTVTELKAQVGGSNAAPAPAAGEKPEASGTKAVDSAEQVAAGAGESKVVDVKSADPKSEEPAAPAKPAEEDPKGSTTGTTGTSTPETPATDGTKTDGTKTDGTKTDGKTDTPKVDTPKSEASQSGSSTSSAPKSDSPSGATKSDDKSTGSADTTASAPKNDTKDGAVQGKSDDGKTEKVGKSAKPGTKADKANKQTPAASEPSNPSGRANGDSGGKRSPAGGKTHQNQGS